LVGEQQGAPRKAEEEAREPPSAALRAFLGGPEKCERRNHKAGSGAAGRPPKRPAKEGYLKPAFRYEKVFETMALACGKIDNTQASCHSNKKNS
jgi:hypothetical protein